MRALLFGLVPAALLAASPEFHRDIEPILQKNCQECHRPGEAAPMAFLTYKETRPWAKAIKQAVLTKKMPPWFADAHYGKFSNERTLTQADIETVARWADSGAPEGSLKSAPAPRTFLEGWNIGKPDLVVEMPSEYRVPTSGTIEYTYFVVPTGFTEDKWVRMAEVRPGNRKVVHHVIAFVREPGSKWLKDAKPGVAFVPQNGERNGGGMGEFLVGYAPGSVPERLEEGRAKLVKAGSDIVLQMHYTADGKEETDRSKVGFVFAKEKPKERVMTMAAANDKFVIPAGDANYQVDSKVSLARDVKIIAFLPHMHLRGKDFEYRLVQDGQTTTLLKVPNYSFSWQLSYLPEKPVTLPKGATIECTAHFDNSANNPNNPDPKKNIRFGEQSWDEMMIGFFDIAFDANLSPRDLFERPQKKTTSD